MMRFLFVSTLPSGDRVPTHTTVFVTLTLIALFQLVISLVTKHFFALGILVNEIIIIAGLPFLVARLLRTRSQLLFPFHAPSFRSIFFSLLFMLGVVIVIDYLVFISEIFFPLPLSYREALERALETSSSVEVVWKFFLLCLVPGVCEEIFFRGFCQTTFQFQLNKKIALFLTAFLFALLHGNLWYVHLYFLLGLALSWVFSITKTLWVPICCHIFNNSWTFLHATWKTTLPLRSTMNVSDILLFAFGMLLLIISTRILNSDKKKGVPI